LYEDGAYLTPKVAKQIMRYYLDETLVKKAMRMKERLLALFANEKEPAVRETGLSRMQTSVLRRIVDGKTTPQIARELNLSENTINTHIKAMYKTLAVHSRPMVIKMAHEKKWIL
jgi:DNA-binding NarL/FixJ family response regulator